MLNINKYLFTVSSQSETRTPVDDRKRIVSDKCGVVDTLAYYTLQSKHAELEKEVEKLKDSLKNYVYVHISFSLRSFISIKKAGETISFFYRIKFLCLINLFSVNIFFLIMHITARIWFIL